MPKLVLSAALDLGITAPPKAEQDNEIFFRRFPPLSLSLASLSNFCFFSTEEHDRASRRLLPQGHTYP